MKYVVRPALALGALDAAQDPKLFKQLANFANEIDLAEDSERAEKKWCQETSDKLQI